jgi:nucleotide-binding universal stress UspA family protein
VREVRIGADRPEDRRQRLGSGEDQREIEPGEDGPKCLLDTPRVLGSPSASTAVRAAASLFGDARASIATVPDEPTLHTGTAIPVLPGVSPDVVQRTFDDLRAEARRQADETAGQAVSQARTLGLDAEAVAVGPAAPAWAALLDAAHRHGADVLVCGTRGRGAFARALLGSTSSSLLHNTDVPLLVVPDGGGGLDGPVVVAYDGSDGAKRAIQAAARAAGLDAVGDTVESDDGEWRAVAGAARAHGASVIAIGTRGQGAARSALLGSVSSGLVQNAELPVLVVPGA